MKKIASSPKLKNFFANEPSCVVHGSGKQCVTGKAPSFSKKAEVVFAKLAQLDVTEEGAKHINQLTTNHLVKSYAKHGDKGFLRQWKNQELVEPIRQLSKLPTKEGQAGLKKGFKEMLNQAIKTFKSLR